MDLGVFDHAPPAHLAFGGLELGFDQRGDATARLQVPGGLGEHQGKGDERNVHGHQVHRLREFKGVPGVGPFDHGNPRVPPQAVVHLSVAHIHRVDPLCAPLQQAVGEPAGGRAHVQGGQSGHVEMKLIEGVGQFDAATADEGQASLHLKFHALGKSGARLQDAARRGVDHPLHDQRLGLFAGLGLAPFDQQPVGPDFFRGCCQKVYSV